MGAQALAPTAIANLAGGGGGGMSGGAAMGSSVTGGMTANGPGGTGPTMPVPDQASGTFVTLGQLARIETAMGPPMIKSEMGQLTGWVYVDVDTSDIGGWVDQDSPAISSTRRLVGTSPSLRPCGAALTAALGTSFSSMLCPTSFAPAIIQA